MGINHGFFKGVGKRLVTAPTYSGQVTIKCAPLMPGVSGMILQAISNENLVVTQVMEVFTHTGALVFNIPIAGGPLVQNGAQIKCGTFGAGFIGLDSSTLPASIISPTARIYKGTLAMTAGNYPNVHGNVGDLYFQQAASGTNKIQRCSTAGSPGTWTTI